MDNTNKTAFWILVFLSFTLGIQLTLFYKDIIEPKPEIVHIESYNEMIPEEYIDNYLIVIKTGNHISEMKYDIITKKLTEVSSYDINK